MPPALMSFWHVRALIFIISSCPRGSAAAALQQLVHGVHDANLLVGGELAMTKHGSIITAWVLSQCVPVALCASTLT
jgi:hypothetical protein